MEITDPASAYALLTTTLRPLLSLPTPLEISLYPLPFACSPPHINIPTPLLLSAFRYGRTLPPSLDGTLISLLVTSEHTPSLTYRRQHLPTTLLRDEIRLTTSLLASPLRKHTKSPLIWAHRRWALKELSDVDVGTEMRTVMKAANEHMGNYYAWQHLRWVIGEYGAPEGMAEDVLEWCETHVSDCGGWSFLGWLFAEGHGGGGEMAGKVMRYGREVARGHESLWGFVRTALAREVMLCGGERKRLVGLLEEWIEQGTEVGEDAEKEIEIERRALKWVQNFGDSYPEEEGKDPV